MGAGTKLSWLGLMLGLCGLLTVERTAIGKTRKAHSHSHGHAHGGEEEGTKKKKKASGDHGHAHGSPFIFGAGLAVSKGFGGKAAAAGGGDSHGHAHGLRLAEEDEHEEEAEEAGAEVELSLSAGYRVTPRIETGLELGFSPEAGILDPTLRGSHTHPLAKNLRLGSSLSLTIPVSKASRDDYKLTTVSLSSGPSLKRGKFTFGGKLGLAMSWFSKTVIVEEEEEAAATLRGINLSRGLGLQEEEHGEEEHTIESGGTGDREFNRYSLTGTTNYRLLKALGLNASLGLAYVKHQFGPSTLETNVTLIQATYTWKSISAALALTLSGAGESFTAPTVPGVSASVNYLYE